LKRIAEQERRISRMYGKLPAKGDLLHHQLEERKYFDSGDFELSKTNKASNIGAIQTGREHPLRESVSHPSSPVPGNSNCDKNANQQAQDVKSTGQAKETSHLPQQMSNEDEKRHTHSGTRNSCEVDSTDSLPTGCSGDVSGFGETEEPKSTDQHELVSDEEGSAL